MSFANGLSYAVRKAFAAVGADGISDGFLGRAGSVVGFAILALVVGSVVALARRIDPVMAGIALLATASLFPAVSYTYYLVFVLPVAARVTRDPDGPPGAGIFDRSAALGDRRRAVGIAMSLFSGAQHRPDRHSARFTAFGDHRRHHNDRSHHGVLAPLAWLITCAAIIVSYALDAAPLLSQ